MAARGNRHNAAVISPLHATPTVLPIPNIKLGTGIGGLVALILLLWQGSRDWHVVQSSARGAEVAKVAGEGAPRAITIADLVALDLLGKEADVAKVAAVQDEPPETRLDLSLRGVFASASERLVGAIIAVGADGRSGLFRIGQEIAPDVVLHAVARRSVVIRRGGALETLRFPDANSGAKAGERAATAPGGDASAQPRAGSADESAAELRRGLRMIGGHPQQ